MLALKSPAIYLLQPVNAPARKQAQAASKRAQQAWSGRKPLEEKPNRAPKEGKVELFTLFTSVDIQKDYGKFTMVYDGRTFRKLVHGLSGTQVPKPGEIMRFVRDIKEAATGNGEIRDYLAANPLRVPIHLQPYVSF